MPRYYVRETFFRPDQEFSRRQSAIPAALYNALSLVLRRGGGQSVFVPIRSMQYQAIVEREEIVFVDSNGGYAHQDGEGGRLIRLAWRLAPAAGRDSLEAPVPCDIIHYFPDLKETEWRLMSELPPVLDLILRREREKDIESPGHRVIPFRCRG